MANVRRDAASDDGFTLVELLVALSLLALTSTLLLASMTTVRRALRAVEELPQKTQTGTVQEFLAELLRSMRPVRTTPEHSEVFVSGNANTLTFVSELSAGGATGGLYIFTLNHHVDQSGSGQLVLKHRLFRRGRDDDAPEYSRPLLDDVERVGFSYYDRATGRWLETWRNAVSLPDLIKIEVQLPERDPRQWGELIVSPRASAE